VDSTFVASDAELCASFYNTDFALWAMFRAQTRSLRVLVAAREFTFAAFRAMSNTTATLNNAIVTTRERAGWLHLDFRSFS